jgi:mRNA-degrading endonuclease RelE of RelBE toxin-antitoxin system
VSLRLIWTESALDDWARLDNQIAGQVDRALTRLAETGYEGALKRLRPPETGHRLRVLDWRALLDLDKEAGTITVLAIEHRSKVYKRR